MEEFQKKIVVVSRGATIDKSVFMGLRNEGIPVVTMIKERLL